jgi:hypothetical protein
MNSAIAFVVQMVSAQLECKMKKSDLDPTKPVFYAGKEYMVMEIGKKTVTIRSVLGGTEHTVPFDECSLEGPKVNTKLTVELVKQRMDGASCVLANMLMDKKLIWKPAAKTFEVTRHYQDAFGLTQHETMVCKTISQAVKAYNK